MTNNYFTTSWYRKYNKFFLWKYLLICCEILWWFLIAFKIKSGFLLLVHKPLYCLPMEPHLEPHTPTYISPSTSHTELFALWTFWAFVYDGFSVWNSLLSLLTFTTCFRNMSSKRPKNFPSLHSLSIKPFPKDSTLLCIIAVLILHPNCLLVSFYHSFIQALHKYWMNINHVTVTLWGTEDKQWTEKLPALMELSF